MQTINYKFYNDIIFPRANWKYLSNRISFRGNIMLFSRDKDDDDDFIPNPNFSSNLASLFVSAGSAGDNNSSLTYTPPKQPKRQNKPQTNPSTAGSRASSLLCAKTVQTFKMVDGAYQNQGKVGVAVLSFVAEEGIAYQMLLYRDKQNHMCTNRITRNFNYHIQPKNYCTFYDKQNVIWSILFDSPAEMAEFNLQVAKCRWLSGESTSPILVQDLWCPVSSSDASKNLAVVGDTVELTYTVVTINNSSQDVGESQRVVVEVESSGWKQALVGVQLNTQRVVILQPFMLGDLNPKEVVYNSPVVVKFSVLQVSKASPPVPLPEITTEGNKNQAKESRQPESLAGEISQEKAEESQRSPKSTKAELINRMARMGQALPFKKTVPTPSDSDETEEDHKTPTQRFGRVPPKPRARVQNCNLPPVPAEGGGVGEPPAATPPIAVSSQVPVQWSAGIQPYMVGSMYPVPQVSSPLDSQSQFNMFLSEVRTTNSELRMGITRLTDKVELLQTKVEDSKVKPASQDISSVLERLMEGELQLKEQLQHVLAAVQSAQLVRPSTEPVSQPGEAGPVPPSQASVEPCQECEHLHRAHTSALEKIKKLQEENEFLQVSLNAQKDALFNAKIADKDQLLQIETLQRQLSEEQMSVLEVNKSVENLQREKEILAEDLQKAKKSVAELQNTLQEKQSSIDRLEEALRDSDAIRMEEVRRNMQLVMYSKPVVAEHIKKILNAVYKLVRVQFEPQSKYDANFIQSVLAETIKAVTLEYLQNGDLLMAEAGQAVPPAVQSQGKGEESNSQYLSRDDRCCLVDVDSKSSSKTISSKGSLTSQANNSHCNKEGEGNNAEENLIGQIENGRSVNIPETNQAAVDPTDDSSDDVWQTHPPRPPAFDEEDVDDDWLNS